MQWPPHVHVYSVGGAVRDQLLGLPIQDRDYVVVGASIEEMATLGFRPVGKDFPIFLHPTTHDEYALARTERKTAKGYKGFKVFAGSHVTLEEDLLRRDLTINAMAMDEQGQLIDPYGGKADLEARLFRHVSPAFAEDPLRILRVARFAARFADFTVADETLQLMRDMVTADEIEALVPERVWQELARGLMERQPSRMLGVLRESGALSRLLPEIDGLFGVSQPAQHHPEIDTGEHVLMVVDQAARMQLSLPARYAALLHDLGKATTPAKFLPSHHGHEARGLKWVSQINTRLKVPSDCRDLAILVAREHGIVHRAGELRADTVRRLFERCDAWRRPDRFKEVLLACQADYLGRYGYQNRPYPQITLLMQALAAARSVDTSALAKQQESTQAIAKAIQDARTTAIQMYLKLQGQTPSAL